MKYWCGPTYFNDYFILRIVARILSYRQSYACMIHDDYFQNEKGSPEIANKVFYRFMRRNSVSAGGSKFKQWRYKREDVLFYLAVKKLGAGRWGKK